MLLTPVNWIHKCSNREAMFTCLLFDVTPVCGRICLNWESQRSRTKTNNKVYYKKIRNYRFALIQKEIAETLARRSWRLFSDVSNPHKAILSSVSLNISKCSPAFQTPSAQVQSQQVKFCLETFRQANMLAGFKMLFWNKSLRDSKKIYNII